jgi:hypothetical protein
MSSESDDTTEAILPLISDRYPNGITTEAPKAILHNFDPMNGNAGRRCTFKFMYRSRSKSFRYCGLWLADVSQRPFRTSVAYHEVRLPAQIRISRLSELKTPSELRSNGHEKQTWKSCVFEYVASAYAPFATYADRDCA